MPRSANKKGKGAKTSGGSRVSPPLNPLRRGMPAQDSITGVKEMIRGGKVYRIIKTAERDDYDQLPTKEQGKPRR